MEQMTIEDISDIRLTLEMPPFDREMLKGIKGLDEISHDLPKYEVAFKRPVFGEWTHKVCIYVGYWHSIDGWNYKDSDIKEWKEIEWKTGDQYRRKEKARWHYQF